MSDYKYCVLVYQSVACPEIDLWLPQEGFKVVTSTLESLPNDLLNNRIDLCILDCIPGKADKHSLMKDVKELYPDLPVIFSVYSGNTDDMLTGLKLGADDYLIRPYDVRELAARALAVIKRYNTVRREVRNDYKIGPIEFKVPERLLTYPDGETYKLTKKEAGILELLCIYRGDSLPKKLLLKKLWGDNNYFNSRSLDVYVVRLRSYLKGYNLKLYYSTLGLVLEDNN